MAMAAEMDDDRCWPKRGSQAAASEVAKGEEL
jgi:hypothetical protein